LGAVSGSGVSKAKRVTSNLNGSHALNKAVGNGSGPAAPAAAESSEKDPNLPRVCPYPHRRPKRSCTGLFMETETNHPNMITDRLGHRVDTHSTHLQSRPSATRSFSIQSPTRRDHLHVLRPRTTITLRRARSTKTSRPKEPTAKTPARPNERRRRE
jgi:hypothetical protein